VLIMSLFTKWTANSGEISEIFLSLLRSAFQASISETSAVKRVPMRKVLPLRFRMLKSRRACPTHVSQRSGEAPCANRTNQWRNLTVFESVRWIERKCGAQEINKLPAALRKSFPNESMLHNVWTPCDADRNVFESDSGLSV